MTDFIRLKTKIADVTINVTLPNLKEDSESKMSILIERRDPTTSSVAVIKLESGEEISKLMDILEFAQKEVNLLRA